MTASGNIAKWIKLFFILMVVGGVLYFLSLIGSIVKLVVIAGLLAYILDPVARQLESRGLSRLMATAVIFLSITLMLAVATIVLLPHISNEVANVRAGIGAGKATLMINNAEAALEAKLAFLGVKDLNLFLKFQEFMKEFGDEVYGYFLNVVGILTNLFIIPFIMFFLLKDGPDIIKQFISLVPNKYFEFTLSLVHKTDMQLGGYLRGQFLDSAIIGGLSGMALWYLDVKYFVIIGVFTGIANLVPFIGPIVGAVPAIIVALIDTGGFIKPMYVALAFVGVQLIDNGAVKPIVVAKMISLHPIMVLLAVIIGGKFFGIMGMLISVPIVGIVKVVIQEAFTSFRKFRVTGIADSS